MQPIPKRLYILFIYILAGIWVLTLLELLDKPPQTMIKPKMIALWPRSGSRPCVLRRGTPNRSWQTGFSAFHFVHESHQRVVSLGILFSVDDCVLDRSCGRMDTHPCSP